MKLKSLVKFSVEEVLEYHKNNPPYHGKISVVSKTPVKTIKDLSLAYTPGVAEPCKLIAEDIEKVWEYTARQNMVAVVTDGTAVLGLGNIGAEAGLPVMEGKCILFKVLAGVDAFPICIKTNDPEKVVATTELLEPSFGGINLEDIAAPNCFYVEDTLERKMSIPVFHDDQHGTAVVFGAALINALKIISKKISEVKFVVNGAGAAGIACTKFLILMGAKDIIICDSKGIIYEGRQAGMNPYKEEIAKVTNREGVMGKLSDAIKDADIFVGLSVGNVVTKEMVRSMADSAAVFAMANPIPEIMPEEALEAGARIVATGRSDYPNQINNVLGFPGIFRGALDVRTRDINETMKMAAAKAIASLIKEEDLREDYIIVNPLHPDVFPVEAAAVAKAAMDSGVANVKVEPEWVEEHCRKLRLLNERWMQEKTSNL